VKTPSKDNEQSLNLAPVPVDKRLSVKELDNVFTKFGNWVGMSKRFLVEKFD